MDCVLGSAFWGEGVGDWLDRIGGTFLGVHGIIILLFLEASILNFSRNYKNHNSHHFNSNMRLGKDSFFKLNFLNYFLHL